MILTKREVKRMRITCNLKSREWGVKMQYKKLMGKQVTRRAKSQFGRSQATSEFNEVTTEGSDLGGETCKVSEPLYSCYILLLRIEF